MTAGMWALGLSRLCAATWFLALRLKHWHALSDLQPQQDSMHAEVGPQSPSRPLLLQVPACCGGRLLC